MMNRSPGSLSSFGVIQACFAAVALAACGSAEVIYGDEGGSGGISTGRGGSTGGSAAAGSGGGGQAGSGRGGTTAAGSAGTSGAAGTTGVAGRGGTTGAAGTTGFGGRGGTTGSAGRGGTTGFAGTTGAGGRGGFTGSAGTTGRGGSGGTTGAAGTTGAGGAVALDCNGTVPAMGTTIASSNRAGNAAGLNWTIWSNGSGGSIITYDIPAFSATWNNSGDFLARLGLQWNATKTYDQYGTITAQFASKKSGTGGGFSYIGIYGWSVSPCVEFYIVDDSYGTMPVNPGSTTNKGMVTIDGGSYILYTRNTTGTGGSKCPGVNNWAQYYSIRRTARTCGQISVTEHFNAWAAAGMPLGMMDQAQILVEVGGGSGRIDFSTASMTAQ